VKRTPLALALAIVFCASFLHAQVSGSGTPGAIAVWESKTTLTSSALTQLRNGNVGLGTTDPQQKFSVMTNSPSGDAIYGSNNSTSSSTFPVGIVGETYAPQGVGIYGSANATSGANVGTFGVTVSPVGTGVEGVSDATNGGGNGTSGVAGYFNAITGTGNGVSGTTYTPSGAGVFGEAEAEGSTANAYGVQGTSSAPKGAGVAGMSSASAGVAGYFDNASAGNLLIGAVNGTHKFRVDGTGKGYFDGGEQTGGADFAESVAVARNPSPYKPGDLLVVDPSGKRQLKLSTQSYSTLVAGIYSTKPGVLATEHSMNEIAANEVPLAIVGIVPCKVTAENGPIAAGDLLVSSSIPGHAMKGTDRSRMLGAVVGKALEPLASGTGVIEVLVTLQ
jgi:hypothetical protein